MALSWIVYAFACLTPVVGSARAKVADVHVCHLLALSVLLICNAAYNCKTCNEISWPHGDLSAHQAHDFFAQFLS